LRPKVPEIAAIVRAISRHECRSPPTGAIAEIPGGVAIRPQAPRRATREPLKCLIERMPDRSSSRCEHAIRQTNKECGSMLNVIGLNMTFGRYLDLFRAPMLLVTRVWVSWQFLKSGWLKLSDWDSTLELFRSEYQVPLLSPTLAAVAGTAGELFFPALLMLGFASRIAALGLFAVNLLAVVSYWHVLGQEGFEAALAQHVLWGFMLVVIVAFGSGRFSLDQALERRGS
jgi:putative oxidoreductase